MGVGVGRTTVLVGTAEATLTGVGVAVWAAEDGRDTSSASTQ